MEESPRKRRRGGHAMLDVWEFANAIEPSSDVQIHKMCDPEHSDSNWDKFKKSTHLVATIVGCNDEQWLVQVWNQSGEKDGKAEFENADDIWLMPDVGSIVRLKKGDAEIKEYSLSTHCVEFEFLAVPAAVAPRKKPRKPSGGKKASGKKSSGKKSSGKRALDKASSDNIEESTGQFTLSRVLTSFKNPRGIRIYARPYMSVHIWTSIYERAYMHAHIQTLIYERPYMHAHIHSLH